MSVSMTFLFLSFFSLLSPDILKEGKENGLMKFPRYVKQKSAVRHFADDYESVTIGNRYCLTC